MYYSFEELVIDFVIVLTCFQSHLDNLFVVEMRDWYQKYNVEKYGMT